MGKPELEDGPPRGYDLPLGVGDEGRDGVDGRRGMPNPGLDGAEGKERLLGGSELRPPDGRLGE
jgi:hypothetical protein